MKTRQKCHRCHKVIKGVVKILTYRKTLGRKSINVVEYYDEACFLQKNKERAINELDQKKRSSKKRSCR